jgi:hypothetical protein
MPTGQHVCAPGHHTCPAAHAALNLSVHVCVNALQTCVRMLQQVLPQPTCCTLWQHRPVCVLPQTWLTGHCGQTQRVQGAAVVSWR